MTRTGIFSLTLLCCFIMTRLAWAQAKVDLIFDFQTKEFKGLEKLDDLKDRDFYSLSIQNINLNLYKVVIDNQDTNVSASLGAINYSGLPLEKLNDLIAKISAASITAAALNKQSGDSSSNTLNLIGKPSKDKPKVDPLEVSAQALSKALSIHQGILLSHAKHLLSINHEIDTLFRYLALRILEGNMDSYSFVNPGDNDVSNNGEPGTLDQKRRIFEVYRGFANQAAALIELQFTITQETAEIAAVGKVYAETLKKKESLNLFYLTLESLCTELMNRTNALKENIGSDTIAKALSKLIDGFNNRSRFYKSMPQQLSKEQAILTIDIKPRQTDSNLPSYHTKLVFPYHRDFSGISSQFYYAFNLGDEVYATKRGLKDTLLSLHKEGTGKGEMGIAALYTYVSDLKVSQANLAIQFGPGISLASKPKPRALAGIALSMGVHHLFIVSAGGIIGYHDILSTAYNTSDQFTTPASGVTVSALKADYYVSIGYMFRL